MTQKASGHEHEPQKTIVFMNDACLLNPPSIPLLPGEIHVWEFPLKLAELRFADFAERLVDEERARAARFHFEVDRRRFVVARASLRSLLASYTSLAVVDLTLVTSEHGKPRLLNPPQDIRFNVSHSADRGLVALGVRRDVGADIEAIRQNVEIDSLAERFFSTREYEYLRRVPHEQKVAAFFRCWTCKEALLKAKGVGLLPGLATVDIDLSGHHARFVPKSSGHPEATKWSLVEIEATSGYAAAIAAEGEISALKVFRCDSGRN